MEHIFTSCAKELFSQSWRHKSHDLTWQFWLEHGKNRNIVKKLKVEIYRVLIEQMNKRSELWVFTQDFASNLCVCPAITASRVGEILMKFATRNFSSYAVALFLYQTKHPVCRTSRSGYDVIWNLILCWYS